MRIFLPVVHMAAFQISARRMRSMNKYHCSCKVLLSTRITLPPTIRNPQTLLNALEDNRLSVRLDFEELPDTSLLVR